MSVELVSRAYEAWNRHDVEAAVALADPDIEIRMSGDFPGMPDAFHGHDGARGFFVSLAEAWESFEVVPQRYEELGDRTLALIRFVGHSRAGVTVEREAAHLVRVRDGLIVELAAYGSWDEARAAAGSANPVEVLRQVYDAWNRQDVEAGVALTHPDIEFRSSGDYPGMREVYRGRDQIADAYTDLAGFWERLELIPHELRELGGGRVLSLYTFVGHGRDGITVEREAAQIVEVEDGLVRSMRTFGSWDEARAAAGVER